MYQINNNDNWTDLNNKRLSPKKLVFLAKIKIVANSSSTCVGLSINSINNNCLKLLLKK